MRTSEDLHKLTDNIYRHLSENFNPGVRNLIVCGRAYHKALTGASVTAKAYIDAISKIGHNCKVTCKGATRDLGEALFQVADSYRNIQRQIEEATKGLMTDFITPLENKLDNEFRIESIAHHKRYLHGHKSVFAPYEKSQRTLNKVRKKSKTKSMVDETQFATKVTVSKDKLDRFRQQGLKLALLDERKSYCYVLDKCLYMAKKCTEYHRTGLELLGGRIREWERITFQPDVLPESSEHLLEITATTNGFLTPPSRGDYSTIAPSDPYRRPPIDYSRSQQDRFLPNDSYRDNTLLSRPVSVPPTPNQGLLVRAVYSHIAEGESQLSFMEGDVISLVGEKADGWHYGHNARTSKYGWFPLAFTEPLEKSLMNSQRYRSVGDLLDNHSVSDHGSLEQENHTLVRRPRSLYEATHLRPANSQNQHFVSEWANKLCSTPYGVHMSRDVASPRHNTSQGLSPSSYSTLSTPNHSSQLYDTEIYATSLYGSMSAWQQQQQHHHSAGPPSPPLPPPPPPDNPPPPSNFRRGPSILSRSSMRQFSEPPTPARSVMSVPAPPPPPLKSSVLSKSAPGTPLNKPRVNQAVSSPNSQTDGMDGTDYQVPPTPHQVSSDSHSNTLGYPNSPHLRPNGTTAQSTPINREEDTSGYATSSNSILSGVKLRSTVTNDRSAPRI